MGLARSNKLYRIGRYDIVEVLGKGGMGVVYKASDRAIGRLVAIKMITSGYTDNASFLKRFMREAQSTGKLQHPNIVIVYELGEHEGMPFLVMEFLEGDSLQSYINSRRAMPLISKLDLIIQACNGLHYAHERNIIHRDIKPANLMVLNDKVVKIVDFGIARVSNETMTLPGQVVGSMHYMSPEQIRGVQVDRRTDVFSTAVVLFQLLTYTLPFEAKDTGSTLLKIVNEPAPPLRNFIQDYPEDLDYILPRALAKSREDRYSTAEEFAFDLYQVQEQLKRDLSAGHIRFAEELIARSELNKAREQLSEVLQVDRQNRRAAELLREVQRKIQTQQRSEQLSGLRAQAEDAMAGNRPDIALKYLEEALALDGTSADLQTMRSRALDARDRQEKSREALRRADSAQWAGELDEAISAIEDALVLDPANTEAQALKARVSRELQEHKRQQQIQGLLDDAQRKISCRSFTEAIEALRRAETLDPEAPAIKELLTLAASGREQEQRRKQVEQLRAAIQETLNRGEITLACDQAAHAFEQFPNDRSLLKLKVLAEKEKDRAEKRQFVDQQIAEARKLLQERRTEQALQILDAACKRFPTEAALLSLTTAVRANFEQEQLEAKKNGYMDRAREAVRRKDFDQACDILELAHAELNSPEIDDFLQMVKDQAATHARQVILDATAEAVARLTSAGAYEEAVDFLKAVLQDESDEELEILLADAHRQLAEFNRRVKESLQTAERLMNAGRAVETVRYLESQAGTLGRSAEFRNALEYARVEQDRLHSIAQAMQTARTALSSQDFEKARETIKQCRQSFGEHVDLTRLAAEIESQHRETGLRTVSRAVGDCRMLLLARSYAAAIELLDSITSWLEFVPADLQERYRGLREEATRGLQRAGKHPEMQQAGLIQNRTGEETEAQLEWSAPAADASLAVNGNRNRDLQELTELRQQSNAMMQLDALDAISARAQLIARRHSGDAELTSVADEVTTSARTRALYITSTGRFSPSHAPETTAPLSEGSPEHRRPASAEFTDPPSAQVDTSTSSFDVTEVGQGTFGVQSPAVHVPSNAPASAPPRARAAATQVDKPRSSTRVTPPIPPEQRSRRTIIVAVVIAIAVVIAFIALWLGRSHSSALVVRSTPSGATVRVKDSVCITPKCKLKLAPGQYKVEASLPGYSMAATTIQIEKGKPIPALDLFLSPMAPDVRVNATFASGKVLLDNHDSGTLKNGQWSRDDLQFGNHSLTVTASNGEARLTFNAAAAQQPAVSVSGGSSALTVIAIAALGSNLHLSCNCKSAYQVFVDGKPSGTLTDAGQGLSNMEEGEHQVKLVAGEDERTMTVKVGNAPLLQIFIADESSAGALLLDTGVDGAEVYVNGAPFHDVSGSIRIPLETRAYDVRVQKDGYEPFGPQRIQIEKDQEAHVEAKLVPNKADAFVAIHGSIPGAKVSIDRQLAGYVGQDGQFYSGPLEPADHVIGVNKQGHTSRIFEAPLKAGEIFNINAGSRQ